MGKKIKIAVNGVEMPLTEYADREGITYAAAYERYKRRKQGKPERKTGKRRVVWTGEDGVTREYESISELARELDVSREWVRQLIKKQEKENG